MEADKVQSGLTPEQPPHNEASKSLTPREATWLVRRCEAKRHDDEKHQLATLQASGGEMAEAITLTQDVADLVRQRQPDQLVAWLERAAASGLQALQRFAHGLRANIDRLQQRVLYRM